MLLFKRIIFISLLFVICSCSATRIHGFQGGKQESIIKCDNQSYIVRKEYDITLNEKLVIDGINYRISKKCVEVGKNEMLSFPEGIVILDDNQKRKKQEPISFSPENYSEKVFFASVKDNSFHSKHLKRYYVSSAEIEIPKGKGILLPTYCIILTKRNKVIYHDGFYVPQKRCRIRVACTHRENVRYSLLPVLKVKDSYKLDYDGSIISNCIINCKGLDIQVGNKRIFDNVVISGTLKNKALVVEWFGCSTSNDAESNKLILESNVIPSALALRVDVHHSANGTYRIGPCYPIENEQWGFDHTCIRDFKGITIYGNGDSTIILGTDTPRQKAGDVFHLVDCKNLCIRNISVSEQLDNSPRQNGINAFSLIHSNENITIENCYVFEMPYYEGPNYPDGGKAYTIQCGPNTVQRNLLFRNNRAKSIAYGLDYTKVTHNDGDVLENVVFEGNVIEKAIAGVVVHEWNSPYQEGINPIIVRNNILSECQVGVNCLTTKACAIISNTIKNTSRPKRIMYYNGVYGIMVNGAYNTTIKDNIINMNDCDSFINIGVYSYIPKYNGSVRNIDVSKNTIKGSYKKETIQVGKPNMTKVEKQLFDGININDNNIQ